MKRPCRGNDAPVAAATKQLQSFDIPNQKAIFASTKSNHLTSKVMKKLLLLFAISLMAMTSAFAETATFDFSTDEAQAAYTINNTSGTICTLSAQQGVVKLDAKDDGDGDGDEYGLYLSSSLYLSLYGENSLFKISVPTGYKITKITFELSDNAGFIHDGTNDNNYTGPVLTISEDKSTETYTAPSDETVTEVAYEASSSVYCPYIRKVIVEYETDAESALAALIGTTVYESPMGYAIYLYHDGQLVFCRNNKIGTPLNSLSIDFTFALNEDGNYETTPKNSGLEEKFIFYVEDDKITKIEEYGNLTLFGTYVPVESNLAALMGETKYKSEAGNSISVNEDGRITNMFEGSGELLANYFMFAHNEAGDFVAYGFGADSPYSFKFHVEGDKVTKIEEYQNYTLKYIYLPVVEEEIPTDITDVEIVKPSLSKTIKVLKNGKIVIIKNGVTYDLSGSVTE